MIQPFKLPIEYLKKKEKVNENIITDLELLKTNSFIPFKKILNLLFICKLKLCIRNKLYDQY